MRYIFLKKLDSIRKSSIILFLFIRKDQLQKEKQLVARLEADVEKLRAELKGEIEAKSGYFIINNLNIIFLKMKLNIL